MLFRSVPHGHAGVFGQLLNGGLFETAVVDAVEHASEHAGVEQLRRFHPSAQVIAHPECPEHVLQLADFVGSTAAMLKHVAQSEQQEFVVVTENGILYELRRQNPDKKFYALSDANGKDGGDCECANCKYMKGYSRMLRA